MGLSERKFGFLSDPPVAGAPFSIDLDESKCIGCGICVRQCPCQVIGLVEKEPSKDQIPACQFACPTGVDIRKYMDVLEKGGSIEDAWHIITEKNPMPAITGRVCPHLCETECNRNYLDSAVNIGGIERFIGDHGIKANLTFKKTDNRYSEKIAVIGAGPSGLSCAYQLTRMGYQVTLFEAKDKIGGMLRYGIPEYRLPAEVVEKELQKIIDLGITLRCNTKIGKDISLDQIKKEFSAVYIAIGAQKAKQLEIEGASLSNVYTGIDFLNAIARKAKIDLGKKVVVIGGGDTAIDAARVAKRLGADVTIVYRRSIKEMPALSSEIEEAQKEGVVIELLSAPVKINTDANNKATSLTCIKMELGDADESGRKTPKPVKETDYTIQLTSLISAVSQAADAEGVEAIINNKGWISADEQHKLNEKGLFAGGDITQDIGLVSQAIGSGRIAAESIDASLRNKQLNTSKPTEISYKDIPLKIMRIKEIEKNESPLLPVKERLSDTKTEVNLALQEGAFRAEFARCLHCGRDKPELTGLEYFGKICIACHNCAAICPQDALIFPNYYKVDKGRWTTEFDIPPAGGGFPNPFNADTAPDFKDLAPKLNDVEKVVYTRRSVRVYKKDQVPKELIHRVLEAGRFAPSAGNSQPWQFLVVQDKKKLDELGVACRKTLGLVTKIYQGKGFLRKLLKGSLAFLKPNSADQRPMVAIQALLTPKFGDKELDLFFGASTVIFVLANRLGISDTSINVGICCQNMVLTAHSLGLGTCYVGFAAEPMNLSSGLRKNFGIQWPYDRVATAIAIGYPAIQVDNAVEREFPRIRWME
jgi:NADPH-dependent glutamate synthase beta subunit-like oxidoreductase/nitroreductase